MGAVSDDFRVTVELEDEGPVADFVDRVRAADLEGDVLARMHDRVVVSHDADKVFFYSRQRGGRARRSSGWSARCSPSTGWPMRRSRSRAGIRSRRTGARPTSRSRTDAGAIERERERYDEREAAEARERGWADFEVRAELPSHRETVRLAKRLEAEGIPVARRWKFLIVGAATEDDANALAERLRAEAPEGTRVIAEGSGALAWQAGEGGRFAFLGGLGG